VNKLYTGKEIESFNVYSQYFTCYLTIMAYSGG